LLAVGQAAYIGARLLLSPGAGALPSVVIVQSMPTGAEVFIDGERRGETPFRAEVAPGEHVLELRKNGRSRTIPLSLAGGMQASQYVELTSAPLRPTASPGPGAGAGAAPAGSTTGAGAAPGAAGSEATAPNGAGQPTTLTGSAAVPAGMAGGPAVGVQPPGTTPSTASTPTGAAVPGAPGTAGSTTTPTPPTAPSRGWLTIESPLNLSIFRSGELLGHSDEGRLSLPAGRQELEVVNDSVGYRAVMTVQVPAGRPVTVPVELPQSTLSISATPAARVWVDGRELGDTPVTQLALPVGPHEVRFVHPELGERRMTVLVRVGATAQAAVNFDR
jgi:hypothetical protein